MCWGVVGDGGGGKCFWVVVREGTDVDKRGQVVGHEMMRDRGGEVWRMGTARLTWGCIRAGTGVAGREYGVKKWMDIEFIIRYFKKKS